MPQSSSLKTDSGQWTSWDKQFRYVWSKIKTAIAYHNTHSERTQMTLFVAFFWIFLPFSFIAIAVLLISCSKCSWTSILIVCMIDLKSLLSFYYRFGTNCHFCEWRRHCIYSLTVEYLTSSIPPMARHILHDQISDARTARYLQQASRQAGRQAEL